MNNHREDDLIEQVALAMFDDAVNRALPRPYTSWWDSSETTRENWLNMARAAIAAHDTALTAKIAGLEGALVEAEAQARRFAGFYPEASDGRNTFTIFADKVAALSPKDGMADG